MAKSKLRRKRVPWKDAAKKSAALESVKHIQNNFLVGLGSGSTAAYVIRALGERIQKKGLRVLGVPTSYQAFMLGVQHGVPLTTLNEHHKLDLAIDGADQIDSKLNLIKGRGGALLKEKIVASAAKQFVIVADETKLVDQLGTNQTIPVEVFPFSLSKILVEIQKIGGKPVLRKSEAKVGPLVTDNGNFVIDADFGRVDDAKELNMQLKLIPGIIETGLFIDMADVVHVGTPNGVKTLLRN